MCVWNFTASPPAPATAVDEGVSQTEAAVMRLGNFGDDRAALRLRRGY